MHWTNQKISVVSPQSRGWYRPVKLTHLLPDGFLTRSKFPLTYHIKGMQMEKYFKSKKKNQKFGSKKFIKFNNFVPDTYFPTKSVILHEWEKPTSTLGKWKLDDNTIIFWGRVESTIWKEGSENVEQICGHTISTIFNNRMVIEFQVFAITLLSVE